MSDLSCWGITNRGVLMVGTPASEQPGLPASTSTRLGIWDTRELECWEPVNLVYC